MWTPIFFFWDWVYLLQIIWCEHATLVVHTFIKVVFTAMTVWCWYSVILNGVFILQQKQDESLLEDIWTLLRAGRLEEACSLCRSAGQVWGTVELFERFILYSFFVPQCLKKNLMSLCWDATLLLQPWRAASLCPFGGVNLFPSLEALEKNGKNRMLQAIEQESGIGHQWRLWKWASYCASEVNKKRKLRSFLTAC